MSTRAELASDRVAIPPGTRHFVVVYQLGKVASTSLVSSLSRVDGVISVQTHFLGLDSFSRILARLVDPSCSEYFARHGLAQLNANVGVERAIGAVRARMYPGVGLSILSLSREPIDWFRSSIIQDIEGYLPSLREIAGKNSQAPAEDAIVTGLPRVGEGIAAALEASGGIDEFLLTDAPRRNALLRRHYGDRSHRVMNEFMFRFLEPYSWFEQHFARYIGIPISEFSVIASQVYRQDLGPGARAYAIRYEDILTSVPIVLDDIGIRDEFQLLRENVSQAKSLAAAVEEGIAAAPVSRLRQLSSASRFAEQFDYTGDPRSLSRPPSVAAKDDDRPLDGQPKPPTSGEQKSRTDA